MPVNTAPRGSRSLALSVALYMAGVIGAVVLYVLLVLYILGFAQVIFYFVNLLERLVHLLWSIS